MFTIGVLSDTHATAYGPVADYLRDLGERYFAETDVILHAGDVTDPALLEIFAPRDVYAVRGNVDPSGMPLSRVIDIRGYRIGLIHGWGARQGLETRVMRAFEGERVDVIVFGHSHMPVCTMVDGILLFNPGSPTDRRSAPYHSIGLLTFGDTVRGEIIAVSGM